jgi:hypothetical protein
VKTPAGVAWGTNWLCCGFEDQLVLRLLAMDQSSAGWLPQVVLCLLLQASIVGGGQLLNRWLAPPPPSPCCAPPLVL